jgi:hypothetical protein
LLSGAPRVTAQTSRLGNGVDNDGDDKQRQANLNQMRCGAYR